MFVYAEDPSGNELGMAFHIQGQAASLKCAYTFAPSVQPETATLESGTYRVVDVLPEFALGPSYTLNIGAFGILSGDQLSAVSVDFEAL